MDPTIVVTGANGSVGQNLLAHAARRADLRVVAVVRSRRAAESLPASDRIDVRIVSYDDLDQLADAMQGATCAVHLAGILLESRTAKYESANVAATASVVEVCRRVGAKHFVLVSVLGASERSRNRYLKSKGEGERLVAESGLYATIIRTPILLGPGTAGAEALERAVASDHTKLVGGGRYVMRPLDLDDLSRAILSSCDAGRPGVHVHELAGPEPVTYRELMERAARVAGRSLTYGSIPLWLVRMGAAVVSRVTGGGISPTVIDVITSDETVEHNADSDLGITLTPLDETLSKFLSPETSAT